MKREKGRSGLYTLQAEDVLAVTFLRNREWTPDVFQNFQLYSKIFTSLCCVLLRCSEDDAQVRYLVSIYLKNICCLL